MKVDENWKSIVYENIRNYSPKNQYLKSSLCFSLGYENVRCYF